MEKQVKASTAAVDKLTAAQQERTALRFFYSPAMRHTPEAAKYRQDVMQKMMESAGLAAAPGSGASPEPEKTKPVEDVLVIEVDDRVAALDVIPADATSSAPPAAASAARANSPPVEDPPAASVAGDSTAAATTLAHKVTTPAAPATQRNGGGTTSAAASRKPQSSWPPQRPSANRSGPPAVSSTAKSQTRRRLPPRTLSRIASALFCFCAVAPCDSKSMTTKGLFCIPLQVVFFPTLLSMSTSVQTLSRDPGHAAGPTRLAAMRRRASQRGCPRRRCAPPSQAGLPAGARRPARLAVGRGRATQPGWPPGGGAPPSQAGLRARERRPGRLATGRGRAPQPACRP